MASPGRPKNPPSPKQMLQEVLPIELIFNEEEVILYNKLVSVYLEDFEADDLTSSDMDDILDLPNIFQGLADGRRYIRREVYE